MRARDVMSNPVVTVAADTPADVAALLLQSHGFWALPVIGPDDRLIGMVTEADLARARVRPGRPAPRPASQPPGAPVTRVADVMSDPVAVACPDTDLVELSTRMLGGRLHGLPIVENARLVGIVTRRDLVRAVTRDDGAIADDVRRRLEGYGGPQRWRVTVSGGVVAITDESARDDDLDPAVVTALAEAVPGVVRVLPLAGRSGRLG